MHEEELELINEAYAEINDTTDESAVSMLVERVVDRIDEAQEAGPSYKVIAKKAGVSEDYVRKFRKYGYTNPSFSVIVGFKRALGFNSFDDMFHEW